MKKADAWSLETHFREKVIGNFSAMGMQGVLDYHRSADDLGVILKSGARKTAYKIWIKNGLLEECGLGWLPECFRDMAYGSILMLMRCGYKLDQIRESALKLPTRYQSELPKNLELSLRWTPGIIFEIDPELLFTGNCSLPDQDGLFDTKIEMQKLLKAIKKQPLKAQLVLFPCGGFVKSDLDDNDWIKNRISALGEDGVYCQPKLATLSETAFLFFSHHVKHDFCRMLPMLEERGHRNYYNVFIETNTLFTNEDSNMEKALFTRYSDLNHNKAIICFKGYYQKNTFKPFEVYGLPLFVIK